MNLPNIRSLCGFRQSFIDSLSTTCLKCVPSCLRRHNQVYPLNLRYDNCEFLQLHPQRRIRVIHFNPLDSLDAPESNVTSTVDSDTVSEVTNPHDDSATDDYWFIRCSHSSFRLLKKNSTNPLNHKSLDTPSRHLNNCEGNILDGVRYSFHRKEKLKPCIEEQIEPINQNKTFDSVVNCLVSIIMEEAISESVHIVTKLQRCLTTSENTSSDCLPQNSEKISSSKKLQNGKLNISPQVTVISGCSNLGFVSEELNPSQVIKSESPTGGKSAKPRAEGVAKRPPTSQQQAKVADSKKLPGKRKASTELENGPKGNSKQPNKPLLLFLHGAGGSAEVWSPLLGYFALAGYEVVAPDLLGHGLSSAPDAPRAYAFACLLQDALQIFDTFVPEPRKCVVIGHAYGCSFAAAVARYRPQSVVQLVMISGGGPTPLAPQRGIYSLPRCLLGCAKPLLLCGFRREYFYAPRGKQLVFGEPLEVPGYVRAHLRRGQEWPQGDTAFHRRIAVPTLLVHGLQDPNITLVEQCEMERTIPRSFLEVLPGAGHCAMQDTPGPLCHMLHCFITLWDKSGALSK